MKYNTIITLMSSGLIGMITIHLVKMNKLKNRIQKLERMLHAHLIEKGQQ